MTKQKGKCRRFVAGCMAMMMAAGSGILPFGGGVFSLGKGENKAHAAGIQPVKINAANFPDDNFRAVISERDYDRDGNGILDANEIGLTLNIYCEGMNIRSVKGVEYFVDLQGLWCKDNEISTIDISKNTDLRGLWCSNNNLTTIDMSHNPELVWVYCYDCNISTLDVSKNPKMAYIECNTNPIKSLDVTHNPELEHLTCGSCELTTLDVSKNPKLSHLDAFGNKLKKLDVTHNPLMKRLDVWNNPGLGAIDISKNPGLQYYNCADNDIKTLDVSKNPELNKLICSYNEIKTLDLSKNPKLVILNCEDNQLTSLNLSKNPKLRYLQAAINNISSLDISNNPFLIKTYKEGEFAQEWFGRSWTIDFGGETSTSDENKYYIWVNDGVVVNAKSGSTTPSTGIIYSDLDDGVNEKDLLTRETVVQTLYELAGKPSVSGLKPSFKDVKSGAWYTNALLWGEKNKICVGYPYISSGNFGVGEWITRQDVCFMLMRYSELKGYKRSIDFGRSDEYIDYYDVDYDHWEAICWSATWNIMAGKGKAGAPKSEQKIDPYGRVTRSEFQTIVKRLFEENGISKSTNIPVSNKAAAVAYNYDNPVWTWNGKNAMAKLVSKNDKNHVIYIQANVTSKITKKPTLTKTGIETCTASVRLNGKKVTTRKEFKAYAFDPDYTGVAKYGSDWWYVKKGQVQYFDSVEKNDNGWWCIKNGKVDFSFTGFAKNSNGWWYCKGGKVDFNKDDVIKGTVNGQSGWWLVKSGKVQFVDSVEKNSSGWWRIKNGKVDFGFTGFAKNSNGWWYCKDGKVDFNKKDVIQGTVSGQSGWWFVSGGMVRFVDSVEKNSNGWWCIKNGKVDFSFTGIAKNSIGSWYCKGGKVQFGYSGTVKYGGKCYTVKDGKVVK